MPNPGIFSKTKRLSERPFRSQPAFLFVYLCIIYYFWNKKYVGV